MSGNRHRPVGWPGYSVHVEPIAGRDVGRFSRVRGGTLAILVALVAAPIVAILVLAVWDQIGGHTDWPNPLELAPITAWAALSAGLSGWTVAPIVKGSWGHGIWEVVLMALVTYVAAILLAPILSSILSLPSVLNGGDVPCNGLNHYQFQCPSGLHGLPAIGALLGGAIEAYELTLVALLVFLPIMVALLIPAAARDMAVRREAT